MGVKKIIRSMVKPAAMSLVAGGVALSLIVTTPSTAQALVPYVPPPVIAGGAAMILPELMAVSSVLGPVGWTIVGVTALGIGLYATKDYWLPYVTGELGAPEDSNADGPPVQVPNGVHDWASYHSLSFEGSAVKFQIADARSSGLTQVVGFALYIKCAGGVNNKVNPDGPVSFVKYRNASATSWGAPNKQTIRCPGSWDTALGAIVGAYGAHPDFPVVGPEDSFYGYSGGTNMLVGGDFLDGSKPGFNPRGADVSYKSSVECIRADGTLFTITASTAGDVGALKVPACDAAESGAHGTGKMKVEALVPQRPAETVWDVQAPPVDPARSLCDSSKPGPGCKLAVSIDGKPCVMGDWACANWSELNQNPDWSPRISCQYGPYAVSIETCNPLERGYEQGGSPATDANTDGNPSTRSDTDPNGQQIPKNGTDVGAAPGGAGSPAAGADTEAAQCWPSGWDSLNPLEWVYKPIVCAAQALFQPKTDVTLRTEAMKEQFTTKVPIAWFGGTIDGIDGGGCPTNWALDLGGKRYSLICDTPVEGLLLSFRPILGAMLIMAALWPLVRSLFYSSIPILKVNPS